MEQFNDLKNPSTVKLKTRLEIDLHGTLLLLSNEYVVVTRFRAGSVLVDFMVLLTRNSTDNKVTIQEKLNTEIEFNRTGHLEKYFPVAGQVVNISGNGEKPVSFFLCVSDYFSYFIYLLFSFQN